MGDVKTPGRVMINVAGSRALDAIALAGGTVAPAFDTVFQLTRGDHTKRVRLSSVLDHPSENIFLKPYDVLYLLKEPKTVSILGALRTNARMEFATEHVTLAEALSQAGGLVDIQAEPAGVFVFRFEPASLVAALQNQPAIASDQDPKVPVIFQADLRHAQDFFLTQSFELQDKDIVFVSTAESVQVDKVLKILLHAAGIAGVITNKNGLAVGE
jgi:polysaccharide export outer membrane protein